MITKLVRASLTMSLLAAVIEAVCLKTEKNKKLKYEETNILKVKKKHDIELP